MKEHPCTSGVDSSDLTGSSKQLLYLDICLGGVTFNFFCLNISELYLNSN